MAKTYINNYKKEGKTFWMVEKTVYFRPTNFNNDLHQNKMCYKKIKKSNIRTKTDANTWLKIKEAEAINIIKERFNKEVPKQYLTLREAHILTNSQDNSTGTKNKYQNIFENYIKPYFDVDGDVKKELTTEKVGFWLGETEKVFEKKTISPKTIYTYRSRVKRIFDFALSEQNLDRTILRLIKTKKPINTQVNYKEIWTKQEVKNFLKHLEGENFVYEVFYRIMERGLRFNEVRGLKVEDLFEFETEGETRFKLNIERQIKNGSATEVQKPKTPNSFRQIYISEKVYKMALKLAEKHQLKRTDFLFKMQHCESVWDTKKIRGVFNNYKNKFTPNKKGMMPHNFRHRLATDALYSGKDVVSIANHLGDTPKEVLKTYALHGASKETLLDI